MRFAGFLACGLVAWTCAEKAAGSQPQSLFTENAIWVWWLCAITWALYCVAFLVKEP